MERKRIDGRKVPAGAAVIRADLTDALIRAFFAEWALHGYAALSLEAVAKRAGAGKAALYRRWPSKAVMAREALDLVGIDLTATTDQGSLEADVHTFLIRVCRVLRHSLIRRIVADLNAEIARSPEFAALLAPFQQARRKHGETILQRAIDRGELSASLDVDLGNDMLIAPIYWRMVVVPGRADAAYIEHLTRVIVAGLRQTSA